MSKAGDTGPLVAKGVGPEYFYPGAGDTPAPRGEKLILLTSGGMAIVGQWVDGSNIIGWQHLHKRNKDKEALIGRNP